MRYLAAVAASPQRDAGVLPSVLASACAGSVTVDAAGAVPYPAAPRALERQRQVGAAS